MAAETYTADGENVSENRDEDLLFAGGMSVPGVDEAALQDQYNDTDRGLIGVDAVGAFHEVVEDRYGRRVVVTDPDGEEHEIDATGRALHEYVAFIVSDRGGWLELADRAVEQTRAELGVEPLADSE